MDKKKRIVIALGGNALGDNLKEQKVIVKTIAVAIIDLVEEGCEVVVVHGNGPQVGIIHNAMGSIPDVPLYISGAMSQTYIGFDLENALRAELLDRGIQNIPVVTVMTQIIVDKEDKSFQKPTKPIGKFMTLEEANIIKKTQGYSIVEDAGRGYRRVVASPEPIDIVEKESIKHLVDGGNVVIAAGGGGIPVVKKEFGYEGVSAVVDKDLASGKMAELLDADYLFILTAVDKIAINFGKANQENLDKISVSEAYKYMEEGQFGVGSMLPKVMAAVTFVKSKAGRQSIIASLEKVGEALVGESGTRIYNK
mgnify:CR=1 FL=1